MERLDSNDSANDDFFELILTRTDDHEFVAVARFHSPEGVMTNVESGQKIADVWRRLVAETPARENMI